MITYRSNQKHLSATFAKYSPREIINGRIIDQFSMVRLHPIALNISGFYYVILGAGFSSGTKRTFFRYSG